jgi:hypothetical protein
MDHIFANAGFLLSVAVIVYGLWRQGQNGAGAPLKAKPKPKQSFDQWARESRQKVYKARRDAPFKDR